MVSFSGIGAGIDLAGLIDAFVAAERIPIRALQTRKADSKQQLDTIGSLVSRLKKLESEAERLDEANEVRSLGITSSNEGQLTAAVSDSAAVGSYRIRVGNLATNQVNMSQVYSEDAPGLVGQGSIGIQVGTDDRVDVVLDGSEDLSTIVRRINDSGAAVTASLIDDGSNFRIMIQADDVGSANAVTFTENSISLGLNQPESVVSAAQDAQFTLNGVNVSRSTNQITDLLEGVTLNLESATAATDSDIQLRVDNDVEGLRTKVESFTNVFNELLGLIGRELSSGATEGTARPLAGDSTLRRLQRSLSSLSSSSYDNDGQRISLGNVGIRLENDGGLVVDADKFNTALASDPDALSNLFAGDGVSSLTARVKALVNEYTISGTGVLPMKLKGLETRMSSFDDQIEDIEDRASRLEDRLRVQYAALDRKMAELNSQFSFVSAAFGGQNGGQNSGSLTGQ